jgi:rod shape-determining protein MreD
MKKLLALLVIFTALLIQTSVFNFFSLWGIKPNLALIAVIYFALFHGTLTAVGTGIIAGLLEDVLSGGLLGINLLIKPLIGYLFSLIGQQMVVLNPINQAVLVILGSLLNSGLTFFILKATSIIIPGKAMLFKIIFLQALYNGLLCIVLIPVLQWLYRFDKKKKPVIP